jgi:hypothetical protein
MLKFPVVGSLSTVISSIKIHSFITKGASGTLLGVPGGVSGTSGELTRGAEALIGLPGGVTRIPGEVLGGKSTLGSVVRGCGCGGGGGALEEDVKGGGVISEYVARVLSKCFCLITFI